MKVNARDHYGALETDLPVPCIEIELTPEEAEELALHLTRTVDMSDPSELIQFTLALREALRK